MALGFQHAAGGAVWALLVLARWIHASFVAAPAQWWLDAVLPAAEESVKSAAREVFWALSRALNGAAGWAAAAFGGRRRPPRAGGRRAAAWASFFAAGSSTLNAVAEAEGLIAASPARPRRPPAPPPRGWRAAAAALAAARARAPAPAPRGLRRSGSDLFERPAGFAVAERLRREGLIESARVGTELVIEAVFDATRAAVRRVLGLGAARRSGALLPGTAGGEAAADADAEGAAWRRGRPRAPGDTPLPLRRSRSVGAWGGGEAGWTAADVVAEAGYPLEEHVVTTSDGYVLTMHRIPRRDARRAVLFQHGILDTSLGWVSSGATGSQAFAAFDAGADVWLGSSRANPPRRHADPERRAAAYWAYSMNELGMEDVAAQVERIDAVKTAELTSVAAAGRLPSAAEAAAAAGAAAATGARSGGAPRRRTLQRSGSDSALEAAALAAAAAARAGGAPVRPPPNEAQLRAAGALVSPRGAAPAGRRASGAFMGLLAPRAGSDGELRRRAGSEPPELASSGGLARSGSLLRRLRPGSPAGGAACGARARAPAPSRLSVDGGASDGDGSGADGPRSHPVPAAAAAAAAERPKVRFAGVPPPSAAEALVTPDRAALDGRERPPWAAAAAAAAWEVPAPPTPTLGGAAASATAAADARALRRAATLGGPAAAQQPPYELAAVGHSLGASSLLIYAVASAALGRPHRLARLVLLTPAGFHRRYPRAVAPFLYILPAVMWALNRLRPGAGAPAYIPSSLLRFIAFKLTVDLQQLPALHELTRAALRLLLNGDASEWDRALAMPHYAVQAMPAISLHLGAHLIQLMRCGRFQLYDYGSPAANSARYGAPAPPDVAALYPLLAGLPVDLVAGRSDGVIAREDVGAHYDAMAAARLDVSLKELDVGHLDVTFAAKEEVTGYVLARLGLRPGAAAAAAAAGARVAGA